jgi:two-component system sensor histidine kinase RegB
MSDNPSMSRAEPERLSAIRRRLAALRWWLLAGLALAVLSGPTFLDIAIPVVPALAVIALLAGFNVLAQRRGASEDFGVPELAGQLGVDLAGMGVLLYLTGGATNPLVSLLLLPVAVAALSLPARWAAGVAAAAIGLYSFLMLHSLPLPIADVERATRLHLGGMWLTFVVSAVLVVWFVTRMTTSLRARDAQLAAAREEALRDAQVVAIGQLAAGAAHELGTPLATMSVLAGELAQDARLPGDAHEDLDLLRRQIAICKEIVGGLTKKAGIERAGASERVPVDAWLEGLMARWRTLWPQATCVLDMARNGDAPPIAVEPALEQSIVNLLNNAAQSAPHGMRLAVRWDSMELQVAVYDEGAGFPERILNRCGAEPLPAHAQGEGIGLWLTRAAVERLGGCLHLANGPVGGVAMITLPLRQLGAAQEKEATP